MTDFYEHCYFRYSLLGVFPPLNITHTAISGNTDRFTSISRTPQSLTQHGSLPPSCSRHLGRYHHQKSSCQVLPQMALLTPTLPSLMTPHFLLQKKQTKKHPNSWQCTHSVICDTTATISKGPLAQKSCPPQHVPGFHSTVHAAILEHFLHNNFLLHGKHTSTSSKPQSQMTRGECWGECNCNSAIENEEEHTKGRNSILGIGGDDNIQRNSSLCIVTGTNREKLGNIELVASKMCSAHWKRRCHNLSCTTTTKFV